MKKKKVLCMLSVFAVGAITACVITANYFKKTFNFSGELSAELGEAFASMEDEDLVS